MSVERSTDVREKGAEKAFIGIVPGVLLLLVAAWFIFYTEDFLILVILLVGGGLGAIVWGTLQVAQSRKVADVPVTCPYCEKVNHLTAEPTEDFSCRDCARLIPIQDGEPIEVFQVRCGKCNELNFYTDRNASLLCESCGAEIPISFDEQDAGKRKKVQAFATVEDTDYYDLVLVDAGPKTEEMITTLQRMLALNRNQVKQIIDESPQVLLTGITRKKADLLSAQISTHGGTAQVDRSETQ